MLDKANNAVAVDYSKVSKSLDDLIKKYDDTIKSIKEMSKALDELAGTKAYDTLKTKMNATKKTANELKKAITNTLAPFSKEINTVVNNFTNFITGVSNVLNSVNTLSSTTSSTGNSLLLFGGVLAEIAAAFYAVALASEKIKNVKGITAIFDGLTGVITSLISLLTAFGGSNKGIIETLGLLGGVLAGIVVTFYAVVNAVSSLKKNGLEGLNAIFGGLVSVLTPLVSLFGTFAGSNTSVLEALLLLDGVLAGIIVTFYAVVNAVSSLKKNGLEGLGIIFSGITGVLEQLVSMMQIFATSGESVWAMVGLLAVALIGLASSVAIIAASTKLIDQEGLKGIEIILTGLVSIITSITALITAFAESGLSLGDAIGLLITVFAAVLVLGAALIAGAALLANNPQYLIALETLTKSICALLLVIAETLPTILTSCSTFMSVVAPLIIEVLTTIGSIILNIIYSLGSVLPPIISSIGQLFSSIFKGIADVINSVGNTLVNILNTIKSLVTTVLDSILNFINKLGPAINNFVDNAISAVTKLINFIVSGIEYLINTLFINSINSLIGKISSLTEIMGIKLPRVPKVELERFVPRLASGAVIPPRQEFLAILGDQKHGTNIEAPLETIKEANREVMREFHGLNSKDREIILKNLTIVTQFGNKEFKKMVMDSIRLTEKEIGKPLLVR